MADLVYKLSLNNDQFNKKLEDVRKNIKMTGASAQKDISPIQKGISSAKGALGKLVVAFGVAKSAGEAFNKMMQSSQTFGDNMTMAINAGKDSVDEFFYSIGTGDFTSFLDGIDSIINKSKEATSALDQLGNTKISYGYVKGRNRREIADARTIANNKDLARDQREEGYGLWKSGLEKLRENATNLENEIINAVIALSAKGTKLHNPSIETIRKMAELDVKNPAYRSSEKERLAREYKEYQTKLTDFNRNPHSMQGGLLTTDQYRLKLAKDYEESILYNNLLVKKNDEEWGGIVNHLVEADNVNEELGSQMEEYNNSLREFRTSLGNIKAKDIIPEESLAEIEAKLKTLRGEFQLAVDNESRKRLYNEISQLENKKHFIEFIAKYNFDSSKGNLNGTGAGLPTTGVSLPKKLDLKEEKFKAETNNINDYANALNMASQAILAFNSTKFEDNGEGMMQWAASTMSAVSGTMGSLMAMAQAKGVASAMALPFPANIAAALSIVSTIVSIFASMPKFADGGIFQSSLTYGDKNLARLNGGEMILNKGQQANLFNAIANNRLGGGSVGGNVTFKIHGKELVGVLSNYSNKVNKVL